MVKVSENSINDLTQDWGLDPENGLPFSGGAVQEFIKKTFSEKMGVFHYDETTNRYLVFADETSRDKYLEDATLTDLVLGTFDAPFNYSAEINLRSKTYSAIPIGSTGNYIEFEFDTKNKNGQSVGEDVICTYTIMRGSNKKIVTQKYRYGTLVKFNVDEYLEEGTNRITVGIVGQNTLAATTVGITYQVVDLRLTDETDISEVYDMATGVKTLSIPFTVSGYGIKTVEWYLDGDKIDFDQVVDEVVDVSSSRVKYITLSNMSRGTHYVEFRAYTIVDNEKFYSKVYHRDIIVENNPDFSINPSIVAVSYETKNFKDFVVDMRQYMAYDLRFAIYNPQSPSETPVDIYMGDNKITTLNVPNGVVNTYSIVPTITGSVKVKVVVGETEYVLNSNVLENTFGISEIKAELEFDFNAIGKSNSEANRENWSNGTYNATLTGFLFTGSSGWVGNRLLIQNGASINFDYSPLESGSTSLGKTLEFELSSSRVSSDTAVLCNLIDENGSGILITASEAKIVSRGGVSLSIKYKSEETNRISFVVNRATGTTNKGLVFIYINGVLSRALNFSAYDDFVSRSKLSFTGTDNSEVILKHVRVYNTALSSDQILNNYILYRDTTDEMLRVYDRNDIYEEGTTNFSVDKLQGQLPVMVVTGDIPTLENTTNKNTQITVDIDYYNLQDPTKSFTLKNAAMRPQGTSSMLYPKKNFRIYSNKLESTVLTVNGNVVKNRLYSFTDKAQPVDCWCLKADFAESSGTHNTGIARLWNDLLVNSTLNGRFVFRTEAQKIAIENGYPYDVRTTIDGFPILMFYRRDENSDLIFIGKYNFNNDKSTESVFGFTGIPGFDNSRMQCWEILNNGDALALFTDVSDFDTRWSEAFESRYPDTSNPRTDDLKAFSQWVNKFNDGANAENFSVEKYEHLQVYLMAAYYVYLMRFGAVDQVVKNAMLTSEDGEHFYFINYDNDTINGLRNNGVLAFDPYIDRQSLDPETGGLAYAYAGHDSVLWNMLERDSDFMEIVKEVDNALYTSGLRYDNVIKYFDEYQANKWNERVYNQDAQYKYVGPYADSGNNNLLMLQGNRQSHRRWWLSRRFSLYDSEFISGDYKGKAFEFKVINNTEPGWTFTIKAGTKMKYGYGIYNPVESGILLEGGESHTFTIRQTLNIGDPVRIYSAVNLERVDLSNILPRLSNIELNNVWNESLGTKLKELILGNGSSVNEILTSISSIAKAKSLEKLDIRGCLNIKSMDLTSNIRLTSLIATNCGLTSVELPSSAPLVELRLPTTLQTIKLKQLTKLTPREVTLNLTNLRSLTITGCKSLSTDLSFIIGYFNDGNVSLSQKYLYMDNILWENVTPDVFLRICDAKDNGMDVTLKGKVILTDSSQDIVDRISASFGAQVFNPNNEFCVKAPDAIYLSGPSELLEGETGKFTASIFSESSGTLIYSIHSGNRTGVSINSETGFLTSVENGASDSTLTIRATYVLTSGDKLYADKTLKILKRVYPSNISIKGPSNPDSENYRYTWDSTVVNVTGRYNAEWVLSGNITQNIQISYQDKDSCVLSGDWDDVAGVLSGILSLTLKKEVDGSVVASSSKNIALTNPNIAVSKATNPEVMRILYSKNLCASPDYMTKTEAALVTSLGSIFRDSRISSFNELKWFTSVTSLGNYCFEYCRNLTSIEIPSSVTSLGNGCFSGCSSLTSITIPSSVTRLGEQCFYRCSSLTSIEIPSSVTSLENSCFYGCSSLTSIEIPSSVTRLGEQCFSGCSSLTSITIPSSVTSLRYACFYGCSSLTSIIVDENNPIYDSRENCNAIIETKSNTMLNGCVSTLIPSSVTSLGYNCFSGCSSLTSIEIPSSVTRLGDSCFYGCSSLTSIEIPSSVTRLGDSCFSGCSSLASIEIPSSVTSLGYSFFYGCSSLASIEIPSSVTSLGYGCFSGCSSLASIEIPSSVTSLGNYCFYGCSSLTSIEIPSSVTSLGEQCFSGCSSLTSITLGANIPNRCFYHCKALNYVALSNKVQTIGNDAFNSCMNLTSLTFTSGNSITSVGSDAFSDSGITQFLGFALLREIGNRAFYNCTSLSKVSFADKEIGPIKECALKVIGSSAFQGCTSLSSIKIPITEGLTISTDVFGNSTSNYTGRNTYNSGTNMLYVFQDKADLFSGSGWDTLLDSEKCGFTISATLNLEV